MPPENTNLDSLIAGNDADYAEPAAPTDQTPAEQSPKPTNAEAKGKPGDPASKSDQPEGESEPGPEAQDQSNAERLERIKAQKAEIDAKLGIDSNSPEGIERIREQRAAASREAQRLAQREQHIADMLAEQGKSIHWDGEKPNIIESPESKAKRLEAISELPDSIAADLSEEDREQMIENPAKFLREYNKKLVDALGMHPEATMDVSDITITDQDQDAASEGFWDTKGKDDAPVYRDRAIFEPLMDETLHGSSIPDEFRDFMAKSKENYAFGLKAVYAMVDSVIAPILAAEMDAEAQKAEKSAQKKQNATEEASLAASGQGKGHSDQSEAEKFMAELFPKSSAA